uniref:Uncharacterized protein n=1 Tax=Plectus sambesii TaxID=2011161 RepID=A0A914X3T4_9BILA
MNGQVNTLAGRFQTGQRLGPSSHRAGAPAYVPNRAKATCALPPPSSRTTRSAQHRCVSPRWCGLAPNISRIINDLNHPVADNLSKQKLTILRWSRRDYALQSIEGIDYALLQLHLVIQWIGYIAFSLSANM